MPLVFQICCSAFTFAFAFAFALLFWHGGWGTPLKSVNVCFKKQLLFSIYFKLQNVNTVNYSEGKLVFQQMGAWLVLLFLSSLLLQTTPPPPVAHLSLKSDTCSLCSELLHHFDSVTFSPSHSLWPLLFFFSHPCPRTPSIVLTSTWHVIFMLLRLVRTSQHDPSVCDLATYSLLTSPVDAGAWQAGCNLWL